MGSDGERLGFIKPQEPILVEVAPISDAWLHEIKYNGFSTQRVLDWAGGRAFTKAGHDWSRRYWPIVAALEKQPAKALILDGEMIAPGTDGRPNFHEIHSRIAWNAELLAFVAFDSLHRDGQDLRTLPAIDRKAMGTGQAGRRYHPVQPARRGRRRRILRRQRQWASRALFRSAGVTHTATAARTRLG